MMIFILPLLGLLVWYNLYNVNTLNKRIAETNRNTLELFSISCERDLRDIESYMANFLANDTDSIQMSYPLSTLQSHVLSDQILLKYRTMMGTKNSMAAFFFHSENNGVTRETYNHSYSYETKAAMESFVFCQENTHRCLGLDVTHPLVHFFAATAITSQKNKKSAGATA